MVLYLVAASSKLHQYPRVIDWWTWSYSFYGRNVRIITPSHFPSATEVSSQASCSHVFGIHTEISQCTHISFTVKYTYLTSVVYSGYLLSAFRCPLGQILLSQDGCAIFCVTSEVWLVQRCEAFSSSSLYVMLITCLAWSRLLIF